MKVELVHLTEKGLVKVITPYNGHFVAKCRNLRGSFKDGAWFFDDSIIDIIKEAMIEIYGVDGTKPVEFCTLKVSNFKGSAHTDAVMLFGRTIAKAFGRDSNAKLGDDIIFVDGSYSSGGSVKNWYTEVNNATFLIKNVIIERTLFPDVQKAIQEGWCEIIPIVKKRSKVDILLEIDRYQGAIEALRIELAE